MSRFFFYKCVLEFLIVKIFFKNRLNHCILLCNRSLLNSLLTSKLQYWLVGILFYMSIVLCTMYIHMYTEWEHTFIYTDYDLEVFLSMCSKKIIWDKLWGMQVTHTVGCRNFYDLMRLSEKIWICIYVFSILCFLPQSARR